MTSRREGWQVSCQVAADEEKEIRMASVKEDAHVVVSEFYEESGQDLFKLAFGRDIERIGAKPKDSCYEHEKTSCLQIALLSR